MLLDLGLLVAQKPMKAMLEGDTSELLLVDVCGAETSQTPGLEIRVQEELFFCYQQTQNRVTHELQSFIRELVLLARRMSVSLFQQPLVREGVSQNLLDSFKTRERLSTLVWVGAWLSFALSSWFLRVWFHGGGRMQRRRGGKGWKLCFWTFFLYIYRGCIESNCRNWNPKRKETLMEMRFWKVRSWVLMIAT